MSIIAVELAGGHLEYPVPGFRFSIENNVGDKYPIHIHIGEDINKWNIRFHFTYDEFIEFANAIEKGGEL